MKRFFLALLVPAVIVLLLNWRLVFTYWQLVFWPPTQSSTPNLSYIPQTDELIIPRLGLSVPIVRSNTDPTAITDWQVIKQDLTQGVSLATKRPLPGQSGTTIITGHSSDWNPHRYSAVFATLSTLQPGDLIYVAWQNQYLTYKVNSRQIINPTDKTFFEQELRQTNSGHRLALITCWPVLTTRQRLVVLASPANNPQQSP